MQKLKLTDAAVWAYGHYTPTNTVCQGIITGAGRSLMGLAPEDIETRARPGNPVQLLLFAKVFHRSVGYSLEGPH